MANLVPLNRNQIARFVGNDPEAIRAIEQLFRAVGELTPSDIATLTQLILDNSLALGAADNKAEVALADAAAATQLARLAELLALAPAQQDPRLDRLSDVSAHSPSDQDILQYDLVQNRWQGVENPVRSTNVLLWLEAY
jgi:hypothetical protein